VGSEVVNVFVVDDDAAVRSALGRLLRSAGYQPGTFGSAEEFLKRGCWVARRMGWSKLPRDLSNRNGCDKTRGVFFAGKNCL
jgi:hypothetical protein